MTVRTCAAVAAILASAGCGASPSAEQPGSGPPVNVHAASLKEGFGTMERLVQAAQKEGTLTVVGLPRDWANYGEIIDAFAEEYGIEVKQLEPGGQQPPGARHRRQAQARRVRPHPGGGGGRRRAVRAVQGSGLARRARPRQGSGRAPGTPPTAATCPSGTTPARCPHPPPSPIWPSPDTRWRSTATRCAPRRRSPA
ncbi:hypothetical protein ACFSTC_05425 [Nonomuraea ferruginea]